MRKLFDTVVIGTSLRREAEHHVAAAVAFARRAGAQVELIHAIESEDLAAAGLEWIPLETWDTLRRDLERELHQQARRLGLTPDELDRVSLQAGSPHRVLAAAAARAGALLALGAAEHRHRPLLGTTAERAVRRASRPTLVVRGELALPPQRLVVPVDFSPLAAATLRAGLDLAGQMDCLEHTPIEAVYVLTPPAYAGQRQLADAAMRTRASAALRRFVEAESGFSRVADTLLFGDAPAQIAGHLRPDDLLVLGTHGQGGFERFLLGSVASDVLRTAPCSVLLVPPHAAVPAWLPAMIPTTEYETFHRFG
jgi:nucleotide-binding universal stress UspA family protein